MSAGEAMLMHGVIATPWRLQTQTTRRRSRSGEEVSVELGKAFWTFDLQTAPLSEDDFKEWLAWLDRREGERVTFTAYSSTQGRPSGVVQGTDASLVPTIDTAGSTLSVSGVGSSLAYAGDMVGYYTAGEGYYAGRIIQQAIAVTGAYVLQVRPAPPAIHSTNRQFSRTNPVAEFRLADEPSISQGVAERRVSFSAIQVIRD